MEDLVHLTIAVDSLKLSQCLLYITAHTNVLVTTHSNTTSFVGYSKSRHAKQRSRCLHSSFSCQHNSLLLVTTCFSARFAREAFHARHTSSSNTTVPARYKVVPDKSAQPFSNLKSLQNEYRFQALQWSAANCYSTQRRRALQKVLQELSLQWSFVSYRKLSLLNISDVQCG